MKKIAVIILNWNNAKDTIEAISSARAIDYLNYEIICVDNGSADGSLEAIQAAFPELTIVKNGENLGFAEGNNRGILHALNHGAEYVFLLNNDAIVDPDILKAFLEAAAQNPKAGVFGAQIFLYNQPTVVWYGGADVHPIKARCYHEERKELSKTGYACGCALFVSAEVVRQVGLMDPKFFLIWEEIDWCRRIQNGGYECLFVPKAMVWHKVSSSFEGGGDGPQWHYYYSRNRLLFLEMHYPLKRLILIYLRTLLPEFFLVLWKARKSPAYRAILRGTKDYFIRRFGKAN